MKLFVLFALLSLSNGANILGIFNHPAKSHTFLGRVLFEELASRGHKVVFMNGYHNKKETANFTNIVIEGIAEDLREREMIYFKHKNDQLQIIKETLEMNYLHLSATFQNEKLKQMIHSNTTFDLIICDYFYNDANLILGHIFKAPVIIFSSFGNTLATSHFTGNDLPFSYVPGASSQLSDDMNYWERMKMTISGSLFLRTLRKSMRKHTELMKRHFDDVPKLSDLYENVALVLANSHYSFETVRPSTPNIISIGGFHMHGAKRIDKEIREVMDKAEHGVIFFSLGSQIKSSNMNNDTVAAIVNTFSKIQSLVLWKFEGSLNFPLPRNVLVKEWFSQTDILSHPNLRLFVTHAGLLSMIEAVHYAVPMIAIPFNGDQMMNSKFIETRSIGKLINLESIDSNKFWNILTEVLYNPRYRNNVKYHSHLLRNQPVKPLESAMFWIEHVIEHGGGPHLKPHSLKLSWYEYYLLDVYAAIIGVALLVIILLLFINFIVYSLASNLLNFREPEKSKQL
ncbi:hypothetical protein WA026_017515 [Henosepilachna vigintioctopunctata]|uniref:UDP-glucuronosyltransferase n=1 Tax=Henosepilachna vigintioctopunctata TaxID=420089 RepID=A0AAW1UZQ8_9CUCU